MEGKGLCDSRPPAESPFYNGSRNGPDRDHDRPPPPNGAVIVIVIGLQLGLQLGRDRPWLLTVCNESFFLSLTHSQNATFKALLGAKMSISVLNLTLESHTKAIILILALKSALKIAFCVCYRPWFAHGP